MFSSGAVKLLSGDPAWRDFTAMRFHYWTQPLPGPLSALAHFSPGGLHTFEAVAMFLVEVVVPFFIFAPRKLRLVAFVPLAGLQLLILSTGNYGFFNLLTLALCLTLLDDRVFERVLRKHAPWIPAPAWRTAIAIPLILLFTTFGLAELFGSLGLRRLVPERIVRWMEPLRGFDSFNGYGLFAVMTKDRPGIILEGSADGVSWAPYEFRYKPGKLDRTPPFLLGHMPRLDWMMWFASLGILRDSVVQLQQQLLEGNSAAAKLFAADPFPTTPPVFLRATTWQYRFSTPQDRSSGAPFWTRTEQGPYCPELTLVNGQLQVVRRMKWLVAPQEFKQVLTAAEAASAIAEGIRSVEPEAELDLCPLADGGPGTVDAALSVEGATERQSLVRDPLGQSVRARWARMPDGSAVQEMAAASGLFLLTRDEYAPKLASTRGTGELLLSALAEGATTVFLGAGGSATNDGGAGALQTLGVRLLDAAGKSLRFGAEELLRLHAIDLSHSRWRGRLIVATDVLNPLLGPNGATPIFGAQKGTDEQSAQLLEDALAHFAEVVRRTLGRDVANVARTGAAGGLAYGLHAVLGAELASGFDTVAELIHLRDRVRACDLVIAGEGRLDGQTTGGQGTGAAGAVGDLARQAHCGTGRGNHPGRAAAPVHRSAHHQPRRQTHPRSRVSAAASRVRRANRSPPQATLSPLGEPLPHRVRHGAETRDRASDPGQLTRESTRM